MIDLYFAPTPNGHKITLFLEETELDYRLIKVDLGKGGQFSSGIFAHFAQQQNSGNC
ncbi:putative glutathione S-transferase [Escherichia coli]|nr:putative glutathione S-transferase [Escherichia coli]